MRPAQIASNVPDDAWGGEFVAENGDIVHIRVSPVYPEDDANRAAAQSYADFIAGLLHSHELTRLVVYIAPKHEITLVCSSGAEACYIDTTREMFVPGEPPADGSFAIEDVVAHEYGHHLAKHRNNKPFPAADFGPKRWSSAVGVCPALASGRMSFDRYRITPYEGFAEAYAVTNGARWSGIVNRRLFFPGPGVRRQIRADVFDPWRTNRRRVIRPKLRRYRGVYLTQTRIRTPLDGILTVRLSVPNRRDMSLFLWRGRLRGRPDMRSARRGNGRDEAVRTLICGEGRFTLGIISTKGGRAAVSVSRP